jgi:flagellar protein FlaG
MTAVNGVGNVQRVDMSSLDVNNNRNAFTKERSWNEDKLSSTSITSTKKEEKPKFDINDLKEEDKKKLDDELKKLNDSLGPAGKVLKFKYNEEAQATYVEVIDAESQKVIASLPPEFLIDLSVQMKELIGMFLDERR